MEWNWLVVLAVVAGVIGNWFGKRQATKSANETLQEILREQAHDRMNFFRAAMREIANELVLRDHWRFVDVKAKAVREVERLSRYGKTDAGHEFAVLAKKYPTYDEFAAFHTRDHVLYSDGGPSQESLEELYLDIVRFISLKRILDPHWPNFIATNGDDLQHSKEYAAKIADTLFKQRIIAAHEVFVRYGRDEGHFDTPEFFVQHVPHVVEIRYGFFFKDTAEYGIFSGFYDDRVFEFVYRSDSSFKKTEPLDTLYGVRLSNQTAAD